MSDRRPPSRQGNNPPPRRPFGARPGGDARSHGPQQRPNGPYRPNGPNNRPANRPAFQSQGDKPRVPSRKNDAPEGADRLQKVLAQAGLGSRRACEELISQGRVTINGEVAKELGVKVDPAKATIHVDGQKVKLERHVYYAVHKPKGYVASNNDPAGKPLVVDLLSEIPQRVYTVGRLDEQSTGLILLTNDGDLANKLAHPKFGVEKIYRVVVAGLPDREILDQLTKGIWLAEGKVRAKRVRIVGQKGQASVLEMVLAEGKNREIRRMLAKLGHKVMSLTRIAVGPVGLKGLGVGEVRPLSARELELLRQVAAGISVPSPKFPDRRPRVSRPGTEPSATAEQHDSDESFEPRRPGQSRPLMADRDNAPRGGRPPQRPQFGNNEQGRPPFRPGGPGNGPRPPYNAEQGRPPFRPGGPGNGPRPPYNAEQGRPPFRPGGPGNGPRPPYNAEQGRPPFRPGGPGNGPRPPYNAEQGRPPFRPGGPGNGPRPPYNAEQDRPPFRAGGNDQGPRPRPQGRPGDNQGPRSPQGRPRIYEGTGEPSQGYNNNAGGGAPQGRPQARPGSVHRSSRPAPPAGAQPIRSGEDAPASRRIIGFEPEARGNGPAAMPSGPGYGGPGGPRLKRPGPKRPPRAAAGLKRPKRPGSSDE